MAAGEGQKLSFEIHECAGQDPEFPAEELTQHSHQARGWHTPRRAKFPVSLTLRLQQPAKIHQIQLLSHEFKIATRVEIFTGNLQPGSRDAQRCSWKRLGFLSFDKNERSGYQARELKSVHVNATAYLLRLVVHQCHSNKLNTDSQVGLIALNLSGVNIGWHQGQQQHQDLASKQHLESQQPSAHSNAAPANEHHSSRASPPQPLGIHQDGAPRPGQQQQQPPGWQDGQLDPTTASQLHDIQQQKAAAVAREDYDEAKRLKQAADRLRAMGSEIAALEARKRAAVEQEDYDTAKALKGQIERMRSAGMASMRIDEGLENKSRRANNPDDIVARAGQGGKSAAPAPLLMPDPMSPPSHAPPRHQPSQPFSRDPSPDPFDEASVGSQDGGPMESHSRTPAQAYDERPAKGGGNYEDGAPNGADVPSISRRLNPDSPEGAPPPSHQLPDGFPPDLPAPEPFSAADAKDADDLVELLGDYTARSFYSKVWQLREAALLHMQHLVQVGIPAERSREAFRTLAQALLRSVRDKVANVFHTTLEVVQSLLEGMAGSVGQREVATLTAELVPVLIETTGSTNARMAAAASENLLHLAGIREVGLAGMAPLFVRPVRNQNAWRPVLGRLQLISQLLPQLGIARGGNGEGFELAGLMRFVGQAFGSPNADVRSTAIRVAAQVHSVVGPAMQQHLPEGLNPKVKGQLDDACGGPKAARVVPPQSVPPAQARTSNKQASLPRQGSGPSAQSKSKAAPASAQGGATGRTAANGLHSPPRPPHVKVPAAAASAAASPAGNEPASPSPMASPDAAAAALNEDPAPFEAELAAREAALGPEHVDVAESLSNLAILYNQKGDMTKALPLYERALHIWEAQKGPEHPEVAHTLTDLAVLHLEQGRDELGRPLLERALRIQEKALGPDHPDVMAIRDVLNSEDD
ncbi:hypothetical protein WJX74_006438 [Apatococcus lobatus]|uniref:TOG domain-containing protein n=1 Tax=Apatococcus lobatus TaxID=904363 RepID=A0AAW1QYK1_9CHLO